MPLPRFEQKPAGGRVQLSAVDPLNLTGVVTPGLRVPATVGKRPWRVGAGQLASKLIRRPVRREFT